MKKTYLTAKHWVKKAAYRAKKEIQESYVNTLNNPDGKQEVFIVLARLMTEW